MLQHVPFLTLSAPQPLLQRLGGFLPGRHLLQPPFELTLGDLQGSGLGLRSERLLLRGATSLRHPGQLSLRRPQGLC